MSRIVNVIPNNLKARQIKFTLATNDKSYVEDFKETMGFLPLIWYGSYAIDTTDIDFFELSITDNIPTLKLVFKDSLSLMKEKLFPTDDTKISVFLNPRTSQLKPIHLDFKIIDFQISEKKYNCVGVLSVNQLYIKEFKSYSKMSSIDVFKKICSEVGLGLNSNVDNTNDKMTWLNSGKTLLDFMYHVMDYAFVSEKTFLLGYVDFYYNFNYVDLEKEINRDLSKEIGVSNTGLEEIFKLPNKENLSQLFLTNDAGFRDSNSYFSNYRIINQSTKISINSGYSTRIKYYDILQKEHLKFNIESIANPSQSKIKLRGQPKDNSFRSANIRYEYGGKIDKDNLHKNWYYAKSHNDRNLIDLEKIGLEITMTIPNYNLYKFQKIRVLISNQGPSPSQGFFNNRLSGDWLIVDIKFRYEVASSSDEGSPGSRVLKQVIQLVKRELEILPEER